MIPPQFLKGGKGKSKACDDKECMHDDGDSDDEGKRMKKLAKVRMMAKMKRGKK